MKVTKIERQQRRNDRYSIYIDGKYSFSVTENDLVKFGLNKDQDLSQENLDNLKTQSLLSKALERAVRYISIRPRSSWEIETYLSKKGYDSNIQQEVRLKLKKLDLLNDLKFARSWVEYRQAISPRSRRKLRAELIKKRIDNEIIEEVLSEVSEEEELETLRELIERNRTKSRYKDRQKLMAYLARQGYPYGLIKEALAELDM